MHEAGLMQEALDLASDRARQAGGRRIHRILLRVGVLSGIVPDALRFAFEALRPGTMAGEATLEIEPVPAVCGCGVCGREFEARAYPADCPWCGGPGAARRRGLELELCSMEIS